MKISIDWLRDYLTLDVPPDELAERLTMTGFEVDGIEHIGPRSLDGVVVGAVLQVRAHPDADRLVLCDVDSGDGEPVQIVCGAPNVAAGQRVPIALPGAVLYVPDREDRSKRVALEIRKSKIRGQVSNGMICAEDELGLSDDHSGIMVLDPSAAIGMPLSEHLGDRAKGDTVLDVELTPNRPDAACHVGIARETAAMLGKSLDLPEGAKELDLMQGAGRVRIDIEDPEACARYAGILVTGVRVAESPDWMKRRLRAVGQRPRNNIVDITNYVMLELGQPLHAFDYDLLREGRIVVRHATDGMSFTTLDGVERTLDGRTLMICDGVGEVAVAGIMGGRNSEVGEETVNVLIESAWFNPPSVRRTARNLGLQTDASYRFERGVDPNGALRAASRAARLMVELAGGRIEEVVDAHPRQTEPRRINLRPRRIGQILGVDIGAQQAADLLSAIGIESTVEKDLVVSTVPTFRPDVEREIDLVEEVARRFGFENIEPPASTAIPYVARPTAPRIRRRTDLLHFLTGLGFREVYTNSLVPPTTAERFAGLHSRAAKAVSTHNAISHEMSALRSSLLPGVLQIAAHNLRHGFQNLRLAEFGHVFQLAEDDTQHQWVEGYSEREFLLLLVTGASIHQAWDRPSQRADLFDVKGIVDAVTNQLGISNAEFRVGTDGVDVASDYLELLRDDVRLGVLGEVSAGELDDLEIEQPVYFAELDWPLLISAAGGGSSSRFVPISRFPAVTRDLAVIVSNDVPSAGLMSTVRSAASPLLSSVEIFDVYTGPELGSGNRSIALSLAFRAERTLVDAEVDKIIQDVVSRLSSDWNARLRSK